MTVISRTKCFRWSVVGVVFLFHVLGTPAVASERQKIRTLTQQWIDASEQGDVEGYFSFVTDDFAWIGTQTDGGYQGRDAVRSFVAPFFETMTFSLEDWTSDEVIISGDRAQAVHVWTGTAMSVPKDGGDKQAQHRRYIDYWAKQPGGSWLCYRHTFVVIGEQEPTVGANDRAPDFAPSEVIDLGALITEDVAQRVAGRAFLALNKLDRPNEFELVRWTVEMPGGSVSGSNSFYTLANHGGPHVDAPNHVGLEGGIDSYPITAFSGRLRVYDVTSYPRGFSVPKAFFEHEDIQPGDVVMLYTNYIPPADDESYPETITLTWDAAEYLAKIPVGAMATDAYSVANLQDQADIGLGDVTAQAVPIHHSFLSRGIPVYEQLFNVDRLLNRDRMYFVGAPVNIRDGDGMVVRPIVFVY